MTLSMYCAGNPSAPLIVLAHGVSDSALGWVELIRHLSGKYYVVAIDHLGHGLSPRVTEPGSPFDAAVPAFCDTLTQLTKQHGSAVIVAHSMGGAIATLAAERYPESVKGLVLEDPAFISPAFQQVYVDKAPQEVIQTKRWATQPEQSIHENRENRPGWTVPEHVAWEFAKATLDPGFISSGVVTFSEPWEDVVARIAVPTLIVTSDTDSVLIGPKKAQLITNPQVKVTIIPGAAHNVRRDKPAEFTEALDQFLARLDSTPQDAQ